MPYPQHQGATPPEPVPPDPGIWALLPPDLQGDDAELLTLFYVERHTLAEIATLHHTTPDICKKRLYRARQRLKQFLEERRGAHGPGSN